MTGLEKSIISTWIGVPTMDILLSNRRDAGGSNPLLSIAQRGDGHLTIQVNHGY